MNVIIQMEKLILHKKLKLKKYLNLNDLFSDKYIK